MSEEQYINFDEYIRQGEPQKRARADAWRVAIGLQAVDGLKTSAYLQELARRNIEGDITIDEAKNLVSQYYIKILIKWSLYWNLIQFLMMKNM